MRHGRTLSRGGGCLRGPQAEAVWGVCGNPDFRFNGRIVIKGVTVPHRHHFIPQAWLKQFGVAERTGGTGSAWVFDLRQCEWSARPRSIKKEIGFEVDLNGPFESRFGALDKEGARLLSMAVALRGRAPFLNSEREGLARYLISPLLRCPSARAQALRSQHMFGGVLQKMIQPGSDSATIILPDGREGKLTSGDANKLLAQTKDDLSFIEMAVDTVVDQQQKPSGLLDILGAAIASRGWFFIQAAPGTRYILGDRPVVFAGSIEGPGDSWLQRCSFYIPLASNLCLACLPQHATSNTQRMFLDIGAAWDKGAWIATDDMVSYLNSRQVCQADRHFYGREPVSLLELFWAGHGKCAWGESAWDWAG